MYTHKKLKYIQKNLQLGGNHKITYRYHPYDIAKCHPYDKCMENKYSILYSYVYLLMGVLQNDKSPLNETCPKKFKYTNCDIKLKMQLEIFLIDITIKLTYLKLCQSQDHFY